MKVKIGALLFLAWMVLVDNPNATAFLIGLTVLCASLAHWSGPLAGVVAGSTLMCVAAWPFLTRRSKG